MTENVETVHTHTHGCIKNRILKFIIRLDDACPYMNEENWIRMEHLLDKYNIKPIVGVIPDYKGDLFDEFKQIDDFWEKYPLKWQNKGWIIAQHGLNHDLSDTVRTEFVGKSYEEQKKILEEGYTILKSKGITPRCFFAPAHTFDDNTIDACADLQYFDFISDGYAYFPYCYRNVLFFPSVFDTPHSISPKGIFTFVFHPNYTEDIAFKKLEDFIKLHKENFDLDLENIIEQFKSRKRNLSDKVLEFSIYIYRKIRNFCKNIF